MRDGVSGRLVQGHDPVEWARVLAALLYDSAERLRMSVAARAHAEGFGWDATTGSLLEVYGEAMASHVQRSHLGAGR